MIIISCDCYYLATSFGYNAKKLPSFIIRLSWPIYFPIKLPLATSPTYLYILCIKYFYFTGSNMPLRCPELVFNVKKMLVICKDIVIIDVLKETSHSYWYLWPFLYIFQLSASSPNKEYFSFLVADFFNWNPSEPFNLIFD